jgi:flagellar basal-body rod protein FlgF
LVSIYGMIMAARTLNALTNRSSVLQNNLANQSTDGYKFDRIIAAFDPATGAPSLARAIDLEQGHLLETSDPFHVALDGPGFFVVQTPNGERLTRNGAFHLLDGVLVDGASRPVLGQHGPIKIGTGTQIEIGRDGLIRVDGVDVDQLRVVTVAAPGRLSKEGISLFVPNGEMTPADPAETRILQGHLEESNVDAIAGIGELIDIQRSFALTMGAMRTMDAVLETVSKNVGQP